MRKNLSAALLLLRFFTAITFNGIAFTAITFIAATALASTQATTQARTPKIILAGDSWSRLPCLFKSAEKAFKRKNLALEILECSKTSQVGAHANWWIKKKNFQKVIQLLQQDLAKPEPEIEIIYLSLGGNDFLADWHKLMTRDEEGAVIAHIREKIREIILAFHAVNPNVKILISGYDYGHSMANHPIKPYRDTHIGMGEPTIFEMQSAMVRFAEGMAQLASLPNVAYMHHYGLMHYYFGVPSLGVPSRTTLPPELISPITNPLGFGGMMEAENFAGSMLRIGQMLIDPIHLSPTGYRYVFEHAVDTYLRQWLTP
jgi:hypothetical protein